ncbi:S1 RNA-binding domain-containing protein [Streptomyces sp. ST2-7A]|uniref:S1 RNA-binding domain-containing protein n=1 Tax=Streptomyces sp. ST2-7A TaxID=2907214 RepID=UPI001F21DAA4|nr:S1 RNA-binding domain-containing protein [Streptomyces sp. ST2-7A]MCE7079796.1 S1 RNA-binding domain-containing protein [Streptomyces sp. ST2-7A]
MTADTVPENEGVPLHVHRVTRYDPADRDEHGHWIGPEDTVSDHGPVEAAYLRAVGLFAAHAGVDHLVVREPSVSPTVRFGLEPSLPESGLGAFFPADPDGFHRGFHDGAKVPLATGQGLVRAMLRDHGLWCRLEVEDVLTVHVGWDQYLYIGTRRPCDEGLADRVRALGLFPEPLPASPYDMELGADEQRYPADDAFWDRLRRAVTANRAGVLEERPVLNMSRWHRLTPDTLDTVRADLTPRAPLAVWPPLSTDIPAVLDALTGEEEVECVLEEDGRLHGVIAHDEDFPHLTVLLSRARAALLLPRREGGAEPLFTGVLPDPDGVLRARWGTEPSRGNHTPLLLTTLRRGQVVGGTVTRIADFGVTFVDIGGFEAMINIPELSRRPFDHPSEIVSPGQEVMAEILDVDPMRERVSLSPRSLCEDPVRKLTEWVGRTVTGRVTKSVPMGVLVRVGDGRKGVEGLLPLAESGEEYPDPSRHPLRRGDTVRVTIVDVDPKRRRITLSWRGATPDG